MHAIDDSSFNYTANITNFSQLVTGVFCKMLDDLAKVPEVEQKIMLEVFKKEKSERYLSVPSLNNPKEGEINMNLWIQDLFNEIKLKFQVGVEPLEKYLNEFNELLFILKLKPEDILKQMDEEDDENPKDVQSIKE